MKRELYIVDDNSDHHFLLYKILKQFTIAYSVRFFVDGKALCQHLMILEQQRQNEQFPSLIILDLNMPGNNGLQLLKLLKNPAQTIFLHSRYIPVIIMSSETREDKILQCYLAGASAFIVKPMEMEKMKNTLQSICEFWLHVNRLPL